MALTLPPAFTSTPLDPPNRSWAEAESHTRNWARDIGLDRTPETTVLLDAAEAGRYATLAWASEDQDRLNLGADLLTWLFVQDRVVDDHPTFSRDPSELERLSREVQYTVCRGGQSDEPIAVALADIVRRASGHMSPAWEYRLANRIAVMLASNVTAAAHRVLGTVIPLPHLIALRLSNSGYSLLLDFVELSCGGTLPASLYYSSDWQDFLDLAGTICKAANDLVSVDRPFAPDDDVFSLVTYLMHAEDMTTSGAFDEITRHTERDITRFLEAERRFPRMFDQLGLTGRDRELADSCVCGVRRIWRGTVEWITECAHYQRPESSVISQPSAGVSE